MTVTPRRSSQVTGNSLPDVVNLPPDIAYAAAKIGDLLDLTKNDPTLTADYVKSGLTAYTYQDQSDSFAFPVPRDRRQLLEHRDVQRKNVDRRSTRPRRRADRRREDHARQARWQGLPDESQAGLSDFANAGVPLRIGRHQFTFNTPAAEAVIDKYTAAYKAGYLPTSVLSSDYQGNTALFDKEEVAWTTSTGYFIQGMKSTEPGLVPKIAPSIAIGTPPLYVQGISVAAKSKNLPLALAFGEFVTNDANQAAFVKIARASCPARRRPPRTRRSQEQRHAGR